MTDPVLESIAELVFADHLVDVHAIEMLAQHDWFNTYCKLNGLDFVTVESRLMVAHDDPVRDVSALRKLANFDQDNLLDLLADLSAIDDHLDPREITIIKNLSQDLERLSPPVEDRLDAGKKRTQALRHLLNQPNKNTSRRVRLLQSIDRLCGQSFVDSIATLTRQSYRIRAWRRRSLFNHQAYWSSLEQTQADTAKLLPQTLKVLEDSSTELQKLRSEFSKISEGSVSSDLPREIRVQLETLIEEVRKSLDSEIEGNLKRVQHDLQAKKRSLHSFCIATVGRTKAGKSTLITALTGRDIDAIGDGRQGFTRYNRAYNFFGMRLIDTPGIGAAGGQGQNFKEAEIRDSDVAQSIYPETDLVCFVIDNDSTVPCIGKMMEDLHHRGKAFMILLNVKASMQGGLNLFRSRLDALFAKEGERSIEGNIAAIRRALLNYIGVQNAQAVPIIPIHAKAALKAKQTDDPAEAEEWQNLSRVDHFLEQLDKLVTQKAWILRQETLRKNPRRELDDIIHVLRQIQQKLDEQSKIFADTQISVGRSVTEIFEDIRPFAEQAVIDLFAPLELAAERFSQKHFKKNQKEFQSLWEKEIKRKSKKMEEDFIKIQDDIKGQLTQRLHELQENIQERLKFQSETFNYKHRVEFDFDIGFEEFLKKSFQNAFRFLGIGLGIAAFFGGGIGLVIAGIIVGIVPSVVDWILPGKEKRRLQAQKKLREELLKPLRREKEKVIQQIDETLKQQREEIKNSLNLGLESNENALLAFSQKIEQCWTHIASQSQHLC